MGVPITPLLKKHSVEFTELRGRILVVDGFNILYQFLTTIRSRDGTPLTDSRGRVTSHLIGLFSRTTALMAKGMKLVFVFDGDAPELKKQERERRQELKQEAQQKFDAAKARDDVDEMKKYASRTARLTPDMLAEAKKLLSALGIPVIQAPSEGEAQAAFMVRRGDAYAVISQDADALLFGAPRVIRNLGVSGRKKKTNTLVYERNLPERIELDETLNTLGLTRKQLIALAMLVGTDFNRGGVHGLGPKKSLKLVQENKDFKVLFSEAQWSDHHEISWQEVMKVFTEMPVNESYELSWSDIDHDAVRSLLIGEHDFSADRVNSTLEKLEKESDKGQKGLQEFFG